MNIQNVHMFCSGLGVHEGSKFAHEAAPFRKCDFLVNERCCYRDLKELELNTLIIMHLTMWEIIVMSHIAVMCFDAHNSGDCIHLHPSQSPKCPAIVSVWTSVYKTHTNTHLFCSGTESINMYYLLRKDTQH